MPGRASTRWTRLVLVVATVLCIGSSAALTESGALLFGATAAAAASSGAASTAHSTTGGPPLTLVSQSPWVTPDQPWFNLEVAVGQPATSAASLHVSLTFYSRLDDAPQYEQSVGAVPDKGVLLRLPDVSVVAAPGGGLLSSACVTVLPNDASTAPASGVGLCAPGSPSLVLGCTPFIGTCGDVYPVSVALERQGASSPLARFTTFLTYEEPAAIGPGGPLRVAMVLPVGTSGVEPMAATLSDHRAVAATLAVSPSGVQQILARRDRGALRALTQLAGLDGDEVLDQSYVPINVAALSAAGIAGEIGAQLARGDTLLHEAALRPAGGPWIDTDSSFSLGDGADLAAGLQAAGASELVLAPDDLASGGLSNYTFAQPFVLDTGHGTGVPAVSVNAALSGRFTAQAADPVLGAEQLVAGLAFVHYEDAYLSDPRGVVVTPPAGWRASTAFMETLLDGMSDNPALRPVTLGQLFSQVPVGGNREPTTLRLQSGPAGQGITRTAAQRIAAARVQLSSFTQAAGGPSGSQSTGGQSNGPSGGQSASDQAAAAQPAALTALSDALLATESRRLGASGRSAALDAYDKAFDTEVAQITLGTERTVTFTSQRAPIPITVLSAAPFPVRVVMTLASDKFTFPNGNTRTLVLDRPTTSVRVVAQARASGDRLPIDVTLRTPDGQLVFAHTVLTVHSTSISFVGVALTVFAALVLLAWWARTWLASRRRRLRAR